MTWRQRWRRRRIKKHVWPRVAWSGPMFNATDQSHLTVEVAISNSLLRDRNEAVVELVGQTVANRVKESTRRHMGLA